MCGRYTIRDPNRMAEYMSRITGEPLAVWRARYNLSPGQNAHVIIRNPRPDKILDVVEMKWGPFYWLSGPKPSLMVNARSETVATKPTFKKSVQQRRCLVPADGFFEWKRDGDLKVPYYFQANQGAPFLIAGLYEEANESYPNSFLLLTTAPNAVMESIHDRMPVMLDEPNAREWLRPGDLKPEEITNLCASYPAEKMSKVRVSSVVNSSRNDVPECVVPVWDGDTGPVEFQLES